MTNALWHIDHCNLPLVKVVDIGAYIGEFSRGASLKGALSVYAFEANPQNYLTLTNAIKEDRVIIPVNLTIVGALDRPYFRYGSGPTSFITYHHTGIPVSKAIRFTDLVKILGPIDYLKMDIEGMEHEIFDGSEELAKALKSIGFLQLEIHKTSPDRSYEHQYMQRISKIIGFLNEYGFTDDPCEVRQRHPGDFCSHNERYLG